jgi:hypothetical protein
LYNSAADANLEVNRGGAFSFAVGDTFSWKSEPAAVYVGEIFNRVTNRLRTGVGWRPGGRALTLKAIYNFDFTKWLDIEGANTRYGSDGIFDSMSHDITLSANWKFFPRTGLIFDVNPGFHMYPFSDVNPMSFPVRVRAGIMGQFTPKLSGLFALGYSNPLTFDSPRGGGAPTIVTGTYIGAMGQGEIRWKITPTTRLAGGFRRRMNPAPLYQYLTNNRFYLVFLQALGSKMTLGLNLGYGILEFGQEQQIDARQLTSRPNGDRLDGHLDARADLRYHLYEWLAFGISNDSDWRITNAQPLGDAGPEGSLGFFRNQTLFVGTLSY